MKPKNTFLCLSCGAIVYKHYKQCPYCGGHLSLWKNNEYVEKDITEKWAKILNAKKYIKFQYGIADLVTKTHVYEVKKKSQWKCALGQILVASHALNLKPGLILFGKGKIPKILEELAKKYEIKLIDELL